MGCGSSKSEVVVLENTRTNARRFSLDERTSNSNNSNGKRRKSRIDGRSLNDSHVMLLTSKRVPVVKSDGRRGSLSLPRQHPRRSTLPNSSQMKRIVEGRNGDEVASDPHDNGIEEFPKYKRRDSIHTLGQFGSLKPASSEDVMLKKQRKSSVTFKSYDSLIVDQDNEDALLDSLDSSIEESIPSSPALVFPKPNHQQHQHQHHQHSHRSPLQQLQHDKIQPPTTFQFPPNCGETHDKKAIGRGAEDDKHTNKVVQSALFNVINRSSGDTSADSSSANESVGGDDWKPKKRVKKRSVSLDPTIAALTKVQPRSIVKSSSSSNETSQVDVLHATNKSTLCSSSTTFTRESLNTSATLSENSQSVLTNSQTSLKPNGGRDSHMLRASSSRHSRNSSVSSVSSIQRQQNSSSNNGGRNSRRGSSHSLSSSPKDKTKKSSSNASLSSSLTSFDILKTSTKQQQPVTSSSNRKSSSRPSSISTASTTQKGDMNGQQNINNHPTSPFKRAGFTSQEEYEAALLKHVLAMTGNTGKADYSNAWGGSQQEYEQEKDFESLMTGEKKQEGIFSKLTLSEEEMTCGRWLKTLNGQGFYVYVHTASHEISGVAPDTFVDMSDKVTSSMPLQKKRKKKPTAISSSSFSTSFNKSSICKNIPYTFDALSNIFTVSKKIPLIALKGGECALDLVKKLEGQSQDRKIILVDTRPLVLPFARTKVKVPDAVENIRKAFVEGMKKGCMVMVDASDQCPSWERISTNQKFKSSIPLNLFNPLSTSHHRTMFVRNKGDGSPVINDGYSVCFCSTLSEQNLKRDFESHVKWDDIQPVVFWETNDNTDSLVNEVAISEAEEFITSSWMNDRSLPIMVQSTASIDKALEVTKCIQVDVSEDSSHRVDMDEFAILLKNKLNFCRSHGVPLILQLKHSSLETLDVLVKGAILPEDVFHLGRTTSSTSVVVQTGFAVALSSHKEGAFVSNEAALATSLTNVDVNLFAVN
eukprot:m.228394 g.228394  ORF g.228394 m.228394 type:complete len:984 (-) comp13876_c0_seq3:2391-5342(-)